MAEEQSSLLSALQRFSTAAAGISVAVGALVLVGWALDIPALKSILPGLASMKANTALCFLLVGISLLLAQKHQEDSGSKLRHRLAQATASAATLLALLTLSEHIFGWDLGIDQLLFKEAPGALQTTSPGRMSPHSAVISILYGVGLLLLEAKSKWARLAGPFLTLAGGLVSYVAVLGYAYSAEELYQIGSLNGMALHSALTFFVFGLGIFAARPEREPMAIVTLGFSRRLAARLFLAALVVPGVLGWFSWAGQNKGMYGSDVSTALLVASTSLIFLVLVYWTAHSLNRLEAERRQASKKLRASEERLNLALRSSGVGTWSWDLADKSVIWDEHMSSLVGLPPDTIQPTYETVMGTIHPEDREQVAQAHTAALHSGDQYRNEFRVVWPDGTVHFLASRGRVYRDAQGAATRMAGASWDITERKRAEQEIRALNAELEQRVEARTAELVAINQELEAFTYSVSHDLRAPLRHISGFSKMLAEEYGRALHPAAQRYLERIQHGTRQMGLLVDDLLNLARIGRQELRRQATGLNSLLEEVLADLKPETEGRQVEWKIGRLPFVECDPALMKQVLHNLSSNALKYTRPREKAVIEVASTMQDGAPVIFFRDNGVGFSMKYADKLFGVFQRLHRPEDFEGTGIGLATVQRVIHKHGGRVWAEAELDKGAAFYFTLGAVEQQRGNQISTTEAVKHDGASDRDLAG